MTPDPQSPLSTPGSGTGSPRWGWQRAWGWQEAQWAPQGRSQHTLGPSCSPVAETQTQSEQPVLGSRDGPQAGAGGGKGRGVDCRVRVLTANFLCLSVTLGEPPNFSEAQFPKL